MGIVWEATEGDRIFFLDIEEVSWLWKGKNSVLFPEVLQEEAMARLYEFGKFASWA